MAIRLTIKSFSLVAIATIGAGALGGCSASSPNGGNGNGNCASLPTCFQQCECQGLDATTCGHACTSGAGGTSAGGSGGTGTGFGGTGSGSGGTGTGSGGTGSGSGGTGTGSGGTGSGSGGTGTGSGGTGSGSSGTGTGSGGSAGSGGANSCGFAWQPQKCDTCMADLCCSQDTACAQDTTCSKYVNCMFSCTANDPIVCDQQCSAYDSAKPLYDPDLNCMFTYCDWACGGSVITGA